MAINYANLFQDLGEVVQLANKMINAGTSVRANTAQTGAASTITLDSGASATDDIYNRRSILLTGGGISEGQIRTITDYDGSTKIATVDTAWSSNPTSTTTFDIQKDWIDDLEQRFDFIAAEYTGAPLVHDDLVDGVATLIDGLKDTVIIQAQNIAGLAIARLQNKETILDEMPQIAGSTTIATILFNLIRQMNDDDEDVEISILALSAVSEDKANTNAGVLLCDATLDGATAPSTDIALNPEYNGQLSELARVETFTAECTNDSEAGTLVGGETFSLTGEKRRATPWDWRTDGSGLGANLTSVQGAGNILNNDFETFTVADTPDNWTIDAGTAGTHILEATSSGDVYHGSSSLGLVGDASLAAITLSQPITYALVPEKRYLFACYVKGNSSLSAGRLLIRFEDGAGVQVGTAEIDMDTAALAAKTSFGIESFHCTMPAEIPDNIEIVITLDGTPSEHSLYIDWMGFGPVTYHGGVNFALVAGSDIFLKGDRYKMTTSYTATGVFQDFFREFFRVQLPSDASPSQADTLATD